MGVDNATLARKYLTELWGKGDLGLVDELADPSIKLSDPMAPPVQGMNALKDRIETMSKDFTDGSVTIEEIASAGDIVAVRARWSGVHKKDFFFGVAAKGKRMTCDAVEWLRIKNGKVVENISYFDVYELFQQLDALPPPDQFKPAEKKAETEKRARA